MIDESKGTLTLDRKAFKVLASETRISILKSLDEKQKTVTDLARELNMNKATMYEHLEQLVSAGLVKRCEGDMRKKVGKSHPLEVDRKFGQRKWIYYKLTWKGKNILHPERVRIMVLLTTFALCICIIITYFLTISYYPEESVVPGEKRIEYGEPSVILVDFSDVKSSEPLISIYIEGEFDYIEVRSTPKTTINIINPEGTHLLDNISVVQCRMSIPKNTSYVKLNITVSNNEKHFYFEEVVYLPTYVNKPLPDLVISNMKHYITKTDAIHVKITVKNIGNGTSGDFYVCLSPSRKLDNLTEYEISYVKGLGPGEAIDVEILMQKGKYDWMYAIVDYNNKIEESNELNNVCFLPLRDKAAKREFALEGSEKSVAPGFTSLVLLISILVLLLSVNKRRIKIQP